MNRIATDEIDMENSLLLPGYNSANKSDTEDNSFLPDYNSAIDETDTEDSLFLPDYNGCDVMSFRSGMQKVSTFRSAVNNVFAPDSKLAYGISNELLSRIGISSLDWLNTGINCEILRVGGKSWQQGKLRIKITVEFCPDE
jgi:hypothetical protein